MACIGHYAWRGWPVSRVQNRHFGATKLLSRGTPTHSQLARLLRTTPSSVTLRVLRRPAAGSGTVDPEKLFSEEPNFDDESIPPPRPQGHSTVLKPVLFTAGIVLLSFGTGSYLQACKRWDAEDKGRRFILPSWEWPDVRGGLIQQRPQSGSAVRDMYDLLCDRWTMLGSAKRTVYTIIGINVGVWMLWQLPHARSKAFMMRHFTHHPGSGRSYTMLTCMFSHESFMHLLFNMYALSGFAPVLQDRGFQGSTEQFVAFYLSTGMLSSLGSHLVGTYRAMSNHVLKPSLGASGAVWAVVAGCAAIAPHMPVGIIFLPGLSFTMGELLPVLLGIDLVGLLRGWEVFDHAAHLAGAISGWLYITYGRDWWDRCQRELDRSRYKLG